MELPNLSMLTGSASRFSGENLGKLVFAITGAIFDQNELRKSHFLVYFDVFEPLELVAEAIGDCKQ